MEIARLLENKKKGKIYGLMGNINISTNNSNISIIEAYKPNTTVKEFLNSSKDISSLKLVMVNSNVIDKHASTLSNEELKCINLAKSLIEKKEYVVLDYFEKGFNYKEKEAYKRLFKKLATEYNETIIVFTNDIEFLWDLCEEIIYVDNDEVTNFSKNAYFELLEYIDKPEISKIIDLIREKEIKIEDYKNVLDLLKAIYRIKEGSNEISN